MFDKSPTLSRFNGGRRKVMSVHLGYVPYIEPETADDRKPMKWAIAVAIAAHLLLFVLILPKGRPAPERIGEPRPVYAVKQVRFKPPPPRAEQQIPKKQEKRRIIPIPDPTPQEPEPIRVAQIEVPDVDLVSDTDALFGIPEGPPGPGISAPAALQLTGNIQPPEKIFAPNPRYTEEARQSRTQGVVILETIVDEEGNVGNIKVLKGLPNGLSEEAVQTASVWKYKPAILEGQPVPVFFNLTIRFSLQ